MNYNELRWRKEGYDPRNVMKNSLINEGVLRLNESLPYPTRAMLQINCGIQLSSSLLFRGSLLFPKEEVILIREQSLKNTSYLQRERERGSNVDRQKLNRLWLRLINQGTIRVRFVPQTFRRLLFQYLLLVHSEVKLLRFVADEEEM